MDACVRQVRIRVVALGYYPIPRGVSCLQAFSNVGKCTNKSWNGQTSEQDWSKSGATIVKRRKFSKNRKSGQRARGENLRIFKEV